MLPLRNVRHDHVIVIKPEEVLCRLFPLFTFRSVCIYKLYSDVARASWTFFVFDLSHLPPPPPLTLLSFTSLLLSSSSSFLSVVPLMCCQRGAWWQAAKAVTTATHCGLWLVRRFVRRVYWRWGWVGVNGCRIFVLQAAQCGVGQIIKY